MKTKCLKLYCECFANKSYCKKTCKCRSCENSENYDGRIKLLLKLSRGTLMLFSIADILAPVAAIVGYQDARKSTVHVFLMVYHALQYALVRSAKILNEVN